METVLPPLLFQGVTQLFLDITSCEDEIVIWAGIILLTIIFDNRFDLRAGQLLVSFTLEMLDVPFPIFQQFNSGNVYPIVLPKAPQVF